MFGKKALAFAACICSAIALWSAPALAQYPERAINAVVPFTVGGSTDIFARLVAQHMGQRLGQTIVVENVGGAGGNIGMDRVAKAEPDGYTILFNSSAAVINPAMFKSMPFDAVDLRPAAIIANSPAVIAVNSDLPASTLSEFVDLVRENPGKYNAAAGGIGTQLPAEVFRLLNDLEIEVIPYLGGGDAILGVANGEADFIIVSAPGLAPHFTSGRIRPLAVASEQRLGEFPDIPTTSEAGMPEYLFSAFFGIYVPADTPDEIVNTLNDAANEVAADPAVAEQFRSLGSEPIQRTPEESMKMYVDEIARLTDVVVEAGIPLIE